MQCCLHQAFNGLMPSLKQVLVWLMGLALPIVECESTKHLLDLRTDLCLVTITHQNVHGSPSPVVVHQGSNEFRRCTHHMCISYKRTPPNADLGVLQTSASKCWCVRGDHVGTCLFMTSQKHASVQRPSLVIQHMKSHWFDSDSAASNNKGQIEHNAVVLYFVSKLPTAISALPV